MWQSKVSRQFPTGWERVKEWFEGISYVHVVAESDGVIDRISPMKRFLIFNIEQTIWIDNVPHTIWFPPDFGEAPPGRSAGLSGRMGKRDICITRVTKS